MVKNTFFKVLFVSWIMFVTFSSLFSLSGVGTSRFNIPHMDKAVHFTFYSVMVFLGYMAIRNKTDQLEKRSKLLWYIVLFAVIYGIIIEVLQHVLTTDRHGDPFDALANSIGAFVGMFVIRFLFFRTPSLK